MKQHNHLVIMAGGIGSRFWPLSTPELPKQFIDVLGCGRTLIQLTLDRFIDICPLENVWVVTNSTYIKLVKEQLPNVPEQQILAEPVARNTAPCIAWACWMIHQVDPFANVVVTPSDALVINLVEFRTVIEEALHFTYDRDAIVTIGIQPSRPETGYGYVECAGEVFHHIHLVKAFKEKPDRVTAERYLKFGNFLWNAGIFVWNVKTIRQMVLRFQPKLALLMEKIISTRNVSELFPLCEKISIDYAVMEPAAASGVVYSRPAEFGWSDLGNWASLYDKLYKDENNNASVGNVHFVNSQDCLVHVESARKVVIEGLNGYIVSEKNGSILICRRSEEQSIKDFCQ